MLELEAIKSERVTDRVYAMLKESIIEGRLRPHSKIQVDDIAGQLGVSRTPVHEALILLAVDGLVEVVPRRGSFVAGFTLDDIAETLDVRRALEVLACENAVRNVTSGDIDVLRELIDKMENSVAHAPTAQQAARLHDAENLEFHQRIVKLSGNTRLVTTYEALRAHLRIARVHLDATAWRERLTLERAEHLDIVSALERHDAVALKVSLESHLRRSSTSLLNDLRQEDHPHA